MNALGNALASVADDLMRRLETDPTFSDFAERLVTEGLRAEQREKVDYYARLLQRSAPASDLDHDERVRVLDALDAVRLHHLRLFHAIATTEVMPPDIQALGDVWETLQWASGINRETAQRDLATLERLQLVEQDWPGSWYLRAKLTEFGLRFEALVTMEEPRARPHWAVAIEGDRDHIGDVIRAFGSADGDPRVVRENGGVYLVSTELDGLNDVGDVRRFAENFLDTAQVVSRISHGTGGRPKVGRVVEWRDGVEVTHDAIDAGQGTASDDWPTPPLAPITARLLKDDAAVAEVLEGLKEGSWEALVECVNLVEREHGERLTGFPEVSEEEMERFDATAVSMGLERPRPGKPERPGGAMVESQAGALVGNIVRAWLYVRSGVWEPRR